MHKYLILNIQPIQKQIYIVLIKQVTMQEQLKLSKASKAFEAGHTQQGLSLIQNLYDQNPDRIHILRNIALTLYKFNRIQAQPYFQNYLSINKDDGEIYYIYAMFLQSIGDDYNAKKNFLLSLNVDPRNHQCQFSYAQFLWRIDEKKQSLKVLTKCVENYQHIPIYEVTLANFLTIEGKFDSAIQHYENAIYRVTTDGDNSISKGNYQSSLTNFAICYLRKQNYVKAIQISEKLIQGEQKNIEGYQIKSSSLSNLNRDEQAKCCFEKYLSFVQSRQYQGYSEKDRKKIVDFRRKYGRLLVKMGKIDPQAVRQYQICRQQDPNSIQAIYQSSLVYYQVRKFAQAIQTLQKGYKIDNQHTQILALWAHCLTLVNNPQQSKKIYEKYLYLNPYNLQVCKRYAHLLLSMGKYEQCYDNVLQRLMKDQPQDSDVLSMAGLYFYNIQCYSDSEVMFRNSLAVNKQSTETLYQFAVLLNKIQKYKQADSIIDQAIYRQPENPVYLLFKATNAIHAKNYQNQQNQHARQQILEIDQEEILHMFQKIQDCLKKQEVKIYQRKLNQQNTVDGQKITLSQEQIQQIMENVSIFKKILQQHQRKYRQQNIVYIDNKKKKRKKSETDKDLAQICQQRQINKLSNQMAGLLLQSIHINKKKPQQNDENTDMKGSYILRKSNVMGRSQKQMHQDHQTLKKSKHPYKGMQKQYDWNQKMNILRKQMMLEMDKLRKQNVQLHQYTHQRLTMVEEDCAKIKEELLWDQKFQQQLNILKAQKRDRCHRYATKLCWMLATSIHAYRGLKLGVLKAGDQAIISKSGQFIQKVGSACEMAKDLPGVGGVLAFVGAVANIYASLQLSVVVEKIVSCTNEFYQDRLLGKAVTEAIQCLITHRKHLQMIQKPHPDQWYEQLLSSIGDKSVDLMSDFKCIKLQQDEKQALVDCGRIFGKMVMLKSPYSDKNTIRLGAIQLLRQKLQQQKLRNNVDQKSPTKNPQKGGCCGDSDSCSLM